MTRSFLLFALLFYGALLLGAACRRGRAWAPGLMRWTILLLEPWLYAYSLWIIDPGRLRLYAPIPAAAVALILFWAWAARPLARRLFPEPERQGAFVLAAAFSNIGTTGGAFLCYLMFGLPGLSLAYLFLLPYPFLVFTLGFGLARHYRGATTRWSVGDYLLAAARDPVSAVPLVAMGIGALLNGLRLAPPAGVLPVVDVLIKADLFLMCFAIGMTLRWPKWRAAWRPSVANAAVKYLASPALGLALAWLAYGSLAPLPAKVLVVESAMPPAIYAVITSNLFDLDRDLANMLWLTSTLLLAPVALVLFRVFG